MLVEDLMTTELVTCDFEASLMTAATRMLENRVGSVIVRRDGDPFGIITETDALSAGVSADLPFGEIPVESVVSHPLVTTSPDTTLRMAVDRMTEHEIKKLAVVDGLTLEGIVTRTDIVAHYGDFINEAHALDDRQERWEARKQDIDEF